MATTIRSLSTFIRKTITTSTSPAYSAGDQIDSIQTLSNALIDTGALGAITSVSILDKDNQRAEIDFFFFAVSPTLVGSDNAAFDITDANAVIAKFLGVATVLSGDYKQSSSNAFATNDRIRIPMKSIAGSKNIYCVLVTRGTPTYSTTSGLEVTFGITQD